MDRFLLESGDFLLLESGDILLLEDTTGPPPGAASGHTMVLDMDGRTVTVYPDMDWPQ